MKVKLTVNYAGKPDEVIFLDDIETALKISDDRNLRTDWVGFNIVSAVIS